MAAKKKKTEQKKEEAKTPEVDPSRTVKLGKASKVPPIDLPPIR